MTIFFPSGQISGSLYIKGGLIYHSHKPLPHPTYFLLCQLRQIFHQILLMMTKLLCFKKLMLHWTQWSCYVHATSLRFTPIPTSIVTLAFPHYQTPWTPTAYHYCSIWYFIYHFIFTISHINSRTWIRVVNRSLLEPIGLRQPIGLRLGFSYSYIYCRITCRYSVRISTSQRRPVHFSW